MISLKMKDLLSEHNEKMIIKIISDIDTFADNETEITLQSIIDAPGIRLLNRFFSSMRFLSVYKDSAVYANKTKALMSNLAIEEFKKINDYHAISFLSMTTQAVSINEKHISATMYQHEIIKLNDLMREEMLNAADGKTGDARFSILRSVKMMLFSSDWLARQYFEAEMCINLCNKVIQQRDGISDDKIKTFDYYTDKFQQSILDNMKAF